MTINLIEGQPFSEKYSLVHRVSENDVADCWVALDMSLEEKVFLKIFKSSLSDDTKHNLGSVITRQKSLQHSFIVRTLEFSESNNHGFVTSAYLQNTEPYLQQGTFAQQWRILRQVGKALEFAHSLGFTHGHLHPGNILINDQGDAYLTDFGVAISKTGNAYFSPQILAGEDPTPRDDVYCFGQLVYAALTGSPAKTGSVQDLPPEIGQLVAAMLHSSPIERPTGLSNVIEKIDNFVSKKDEPVGFKPAIDNRDLHKLPREQKTVSTNVVLGGLTLLAIMAIVVFFLLPETKPTVSTQKPNIDPSPKVLEVEKAEELAPFEIAQLKKMEEQGTKLATRLLRLQIEVEDIGGQVWASGQYNESVQLGISGDDAYREKQYKKAFEQYQSGIEVLDKILASADDIFKANQQTGDQALIDGDAKLAIESFTILNAIKPSDMDILDKLQRAESLEKVLRYMEEGETLEKNGELNKALDRFSQAYSLDKLWLAAKTAKSRVNDKIDNQAFNHQMSLAFSALRESQFEEARTRFGAAQKILPHSNAPKDGLEQITIAETQSIIEQHKTASIEAEKAENWTLASKEYENILSIASGTTYASNGLKRAKERLLLENELNKFILQAYLMVTDDALNEAKSVLLKAYKIKGAGEKLQKQMNELSYLISLARIPINVEIFSNNKTDVTVYKIRALGPITSVTLPLYPGKYTIVGKRRGYRDVHKEITLQGGVPAPSIEISCVERI